MPELLGGSDKRLLAMYAEGRYTKRPSGRQRRTASVATLKVLADHRFVEVGPPDLARGEITVTDAGREYLARNREDLAAPTNSVSLESWRITGTCRLKGADEAWDEAVANLKQVYDAQLSRFDQDPKLTLTVSLDRRFEED